MTNRLDIAVGIPYQNVPVQTSQYNFQPTYQQRQTNTQQMQTTSCDPCSGVPQGPFAHSYQTGSYLPAHHQNNTPNAQANITNPYQSTFQNPFNPHPTHPNYGQLPQNILDQIRACVNNAAPIFILPGNCQQSPASQQQPFAPILPQAMGLSSTTTYPPSGLTYPGVCYPPPFYPYPVLPLPYCDHCIRARETMQNCIRCCSKRDTDSTDSKNILRSATYRYDIERDEHHCTPTADDTVCSKRDCPSSLHLQALASQFLSIQGIIPCAATRLILRKISGSNVTTTMEDTMTRAQKSINSLTKDQLLSESRNAHQVNTLINLHMTANPPSNIIPVLTLVQLKMNLLKAQVEGLINQRLMESQGVAVEVDISAIDPTILALKSDVELRDFLSVLRQKECDERINVNFAPYHSQRVIAETRLCNIQNKIRQVENEFDRRRCTMIPAPTLSSRIIQQFSGPCYSARFEDPRRLYSALSSHTSPDPFVIKPRSPKRLLLKPYVGNSETATQATDTVAPTVIPEKTTNENVDRTQVNPTSDQSPNKVENDINNETESQKIVSEAKKKLRTRIVRISRTVNDAETLNAISLMREASNICMKIAVGRYACVKNCEEENDEISTKEIPCSSDAKCWITETYINVGDDESVKTLTESQSDTNTLKEKIDVSDSQNGIAIRHSEEIINDRKVFESTTNLRQFEEGAIETVRKADEAIKGHNIEIESLQVVSPAERIEKKEVKTTTVTEVSDNAPNSNVITREMKQKANGIYSSSLKIILRSKKEKGEDKQKDEDGGSLPLSTSTLMERSANETPISNKREKMKLYIVSDMISIIWDKDREYKIKPRVDKKKRANEKEKNVAIHTDIKKSYKYSSASNLLKNASTHDIIEKEHCDDIFPEPSKFYIDHQCQTTQAFLEEKILTALFTKTNIFPPLKNLPNYISNKESNVDDVGTCPSPIIKSRIVNMRHLSQCRNVIENTPVTLHKDDMPYLSNMEYTENFIWYIFLIIGNHVVIFIQRTIIFNKGSLHLSYDEYIP